jgi:hypothetical protein
VEAPFCNANTELQLPHCALAAATFLDWDGWDPLQLPHPLETADSKRSRCVLIKKVLFVTGNSAQQDHAATVQVHLDYSTEGLACSMSARPWKHNYAICFRCTHNSRGSSWLFIVFHPQPALH